jgi:hypothetical protein
MHPPTPNPQPPTPNPQPPTPNPHSFHLHQWCCALQEALSSNAAFVFFKLHAPRAASADVKTLSELSKRCAVQGLGFRVWGLGFGV